MAIDQYGQAIPDNFTEGKEITPVSPLSFNNRTEKSRTAIDAVRGRLAKEAQKIDGRQFQAGYVAPKE